MVADNDPIDRALRWFVYGPLGLAAYLREHGPSFMNVFVARGEREFACARRSLESRLGRARPASEPAASSAPTPGFPQRVANGLGRVASQATTIVAGAAGTRAGTPEPAGVLGPGDLPIPGYDGLSASQVIERLEGLSRGALERIRAYELAHRARRTILASIDQLTR